MSNTFNNLFNRSNGQRDILSQREHDERVRCAVELWFDASVAIAKMNLPAGSQHVPQPPPGMNADGRALFLEKLLTLDQPLREKMLASYNNGAIPPDSLLKAELLVRKQLQGQSKQIDDPAPKP
jgi:hypothetical protein